MASLAGTLSVGEPFLKWNKKEVKVCWQDLDPIPLERFDELHIKKMELFKKTLATIEASSKQIIQEVITSEYTEVRTGIHFSGWKSCKDSANYDVVLFMGKQNASVGGYASLGSGHIDSHANYSLLEKGKLAFVYLDVDPGEGSRLNLNEHLRMGALHEFGHLAGLRHEHLRKEAQGDILCDVAYIDLIETADLKTRNFSSYDPNSIMNYCYMESLRLEIGSQFYTYPVNPILGPELKNFYVMWEKSRLAKAFVDKTLLEEKPFKESGLTEHHIKIGLSQKDVHGLKCLYLFDKGEFDGKCKADFNP
jgi:hypothetical protein